MTALTRYWKEPGVTKEDVTAFTLDLDGDGKDEIMFAASNFRRLEERHANDDESAHYFVYGGVQRIDTIKFNCN